MNLLCKLFGHKYMPIYTATGDKIIITYCERCGRKPYHEDDEQRYDLGDILRKSTGSGMCSLTGSEGCDQCINYGCALGHAPKYKNASISDLLIDLHNQISRVEASLLREINNIETKE